MHGWRKSALFIGISLAVAGCPKGKTDFNHGRKAQDLNDYDAAFEYYQKALKTDPENAEYKIKFDQARFGAGEAQLLDSPDRKDVLLNKVHAPNVLQPSTLANWNNRNKIATPFAEAGRPTSILRCMTPNFP